MKKVFIILSIFILCGFTSLFFLPPKELTAMDCYEFGWCKKGMTINIQGNLVTISKDYCLQNNFKWFENDQSCNIR